MSRSAQPKRAPGRVVKRKALSGPRPERAKPVPSNDSHPSRAAGSGYADGPQVETLHSFLLIIEIANFGLLRRHLGVPRAESLALEVAEGVAGAVPDSTCEVIGRSQIELLLVSERPDAGTAAMARIRAAFALPINLDGEQHQVSLIIGGATAVLDCHDPVRLSELAESALSQARSEDTDIIRDLATERNAIDPLALMRDLPIAIAQGQMFLQYQPKVHVRQQEVASAEALVRWRHPERGLILPGDFIALAEQCGQIGQLTLWTLRRVLQDQAYLRAEGHDLPIFVNISGLLLGDPDFVRQACSMLRDSQARIGFEITETAVIRDPATAIAHLKLFDDVGIPIAIDDYGAGLSSLAYLKQLPARELKIDKLFVTQLTSSNRDPLIVRSTIDLAHALEMEVTAEGVETPAAMALLSVMGCDMIQGYLISRPIEIGAFREFLSQERHLSAVVRPQPSFRRHDGFWKSA